MCSVRFSLDMINTAAPPDQHLRLRQGLYYTITRFEKSKIILLNLFVIKWSSNICLQHSFTTTYTIVCYNSSACDTLHLSQKLSPL